MYLTDEELRRAARLVAKAEFAQWSAFTAEPDHQFSERFQQEMQELIGKVKAGKIKQVRARMGWQYYAKHGIAAVLLCFLLSCVVMPEAVMAGCQKVLSIVETVFEEYTEYHIISNVEGQIPFEPITLHYLPEGVIEAEREEHDTVLRLIYQNDEGENLLIINQRTFSKDVEHNYIADTEDAKIKCYTIQNEPVQMMIKEGIIQFLWEHGAYFINGQTTLSMDELIRVLNNAEILNEKS